jgi:glycosyltransferase involved in cell wall biosynthesis
VRVGVVFKKSSPTAGGENALCKSLIDAVKNNTCSRHSFVIFDDAAQRGDQSKSGSLFKRVRQFVGSYGRMGPAARQQQRWSKGISFSSNELALLEQRVRDADIDVVWFLVPGNAPVSVPFITTVWDLQHRLQPFFPEVSVTGWTWENRERSYRCSLLRAARIITGTNVGKEEIVRFYGVAPENVRVIPLPSPMSSEREPRVNVREKFRLGREFIFYPAQFWPHKNHVNLLVALDLLRQQNLDVDLVLTGTDTGNRMHVAQTVNNLALNSRVHMLGFVTREEVEALYREAIALVYPSYFGPDNLPPLEAFTLNCPVAAARVPGAQEQLADAALLFNPADPADIATAVKTLYHDGKLRERLMKRGNELAASRTPGCYLAQICEILDEFEPIRSCWGRGYVHL